MFVADTGPLDIGEVGATLEAPADKEKRYGWSKYIYNGEKVTREEDGVHFDDFD